MPEDWTSHPNSLCAMGPQPQIMTGLFVALLREHYADANNIEHEVFRDRLYRRVPDPNATGILIEDSNVWTPGRTQKRPAIVVKRNAWEHMKRFTLDSLSGTSEDGWPQYTKLWRGSHTIFCISPEGGECETLVAETYRFLMHLGPVFRREFNLLKFELMQVGPLSMLEETSKHWTVPITVAYGWSETWIIRQHQPFTHDLRLSEIFNTYLGE